MKMNSKELIDRLIQISEQLISHGESIDNSFMRMKGMEIESISRTLKKLNNENKKSV
jgi:hypothetical protein